MTPGKTKSSEYDAGKALTLQLGPRHDAGGNLTSRAPGGALFEGFNAIAIVGVAAAAHQGFSCNLFTLPSDVFPRGAVGSLIGIGSTAGAIGGMLIAKYAG